MMDMSDVKALNESWKHCLLQPCARTLRSERLKYSDLHKGRHTFDQMIAAKARLMEAKQQFLKEVGWHLYAKGFAQRLAFELPKAERS